MPIAVGDRNNGQNAVGTSHTVNLPTGIAAGNRLAVLVGFDGSQTPGWPGDGTLTGGWRQMGILATTALTIEVRERQADGSEGSTITVTTGGSVEGAHRSLRITGQHTTELGVFASAQGNTVNPGFLPVTPSWGAEEDLWVAWGATDNPTATISVFPASYTNTFSQNGSRLIYSSERILNAATEDPGDMTQSAASPWRCATCAWRPFGVGAVPLAWEMGWVA
jgi:hypothetical protein